MSFLPVSVLRRIVDNNLIADKYLKIKIIEYDRQWEVRVSFRSAEGIKSNRQYQEKPVEDMEETLRILEAQYKRKGYSWWYGAELVHNPTTPWTAEWIRRFQDHLNFGDGDGVGLSQNLGHFWTSDIVREFSDRLIWPQLSRNAALPWSLDFIEEFQEKLDWNTLINSLCEWRDGLIEGYQNRLNLFEKAVSSDEFQSFYQEAGINSSIWEWCESIRWEDVPSSYRVKARQWRRKPFLAKMEQLAGESALKSGEMLEEWIQSTLTEPVIQLFGAVYGPSRMKSRLFISYLSQLFKAGETGMHNLIRDGKFQFLQSYLTKRPENFFAPLIKAQGPQWHERVDAAVSTGLNQYKSQDYAALHPMSWICFPKKEFTPPVWEISPGKGFGPFKMGMNRQQVKDAYGPADSIDRSAWEHYLHDHLQLIYDDKGELNQIVIDRIGAGLPGSRGQP